MKRILLIGVYLVAMSDIAQSQSSNDVSYISNVIIRSSLDSLYYQKKVPCKKSDLKKDRSLPKDVRICSADKMKDTTVVVQPIYGRNKRPLTARANIYIDSKDKSKLRVNYWLFKPRPGSIYDVVDSQVINSSEQCATNNSIKTVEGALDILKEDSQYYKCKRYYANEIIRQTDFFIPLKNREWVEFSYFSANITAIAIPLKYYFQVGDDLANVPSRAVTSVNGNIYWNIRRGKAKYFYERNSNNKIYLKNQFSAGLITGVSITEINDSNSLIKRAQDDSLSSSRYAPTFSFGAGVTYGYRQFNFGIFGGWDFAIGTDHSYWDYQGRPWIGFGISVSSLLSIL